MTIENFKITKNNRDYIPATLNVGGEKILYVSLPYRGCTKNPACLFCGVRERRNRSLDLNEAFGSEVLAVVSDLLNEHMPDALVLYIGGNILRPEEMYQPVITEEIPRLISEHATCNAYEIEVRADDILKFGNCIEKIRANLGEKELRIRIGIEYIDDGLNWRHRKGLTKGTIDQAIGLLNKSGTKWHGYVMLGGLDLDQSSARTSAKKTAYFMIDNGAFRISINGMFATGSLEMQYGKRIYVPTYSDLEAVVRDIFRHCKGNEKKIILKIGFEEDDMEYMVRLPYMQKGVSAETLLEKIAVFNRTQDFSSLI